MSLVFGIDPGLSGGVAVLPLKTGIPVEAIPMPTMGNEVDAGALHAFMGSRARIVPPGEAYCYIEKVGAMPGNGGCSMFKFGTGYGMARAVAACLHLRTFLVTPQAWKKVVLAGTKKDKDAAIAFCRMAFPEVSLLRTIRCTEPSDGMADAIAIGEYGRRVLQ